MSYLYTQLMGKYFWDFDNFADNFEDIILTQNETRDLRSLDSHLQWIHQNFESKGSQFVLSLDYQILGHCYEMLTTRNNLWQSTHPLIFLSCYNYLPMYRVSQKLRCCPQPPWLWKFWFWTLKRPSFKIKKALNWTLSIIIPLRIESKHHSYCIGYWLDIEMWEISFWDTLSFDSSTKWCLQDIFRSLPRSIKTVQIFVTLLLELQEYSSMYSSMYSSFTIYH